MTKCAQTEGRRPAPRSSSLGPPFSVCWYWRTVHRPSCRLPPSFIRMPCAAFVRGPKPVDVSLTHCARLQLGADGLIGGRAIVRVIQHTQFRHSMRLIIGTSVMIIFDMYRATFIMHHASSSSSSSSASITAPFAVNKATIAEWPLARARDIAVRPC